MLTSWTFIQLFLQKYGYEYHAEINFGLKIELKFMKMEWREKKISYGMKIDVLWYEWDGFLWVCMESSDAYECKNI